jgi:hypothetical protein
MLSSDEEGNLTRSCWWSDLICSGFMVNDYDYEVVMERSTRKTHLKGPTRFNEECIPVCFMHHCRTKSSGELPQNESE